jgi:hypothetical protein
MMALLLIFRISQHEIVPRRTTGIRRARAARRRLTRGSRILPLAPDTEPFVWLIDSSADRASTLDYRI